MVSAQPGLIPQMSGCLTNLRVMAAMIFVSHFSDHVYVYLMKDLTLSKTILAKHAYEHFLASLGIESKAHHADNGRFADKGFRDDSTSSNQTITFCGVGSHHQNGIAESKNKVIYTWWSNITSSCKAYVSRVYLNNSLAFCCEMLQGQT